MGLLSISIHHDVHGLDRVERAARATDGLAKTLHSRPDVRGVLVLSTCNRVEIYADTPPGVDPTRLAFQVVNMLFPDEPMPTESCPVASRAGVLLEDEALAHLFEVAAGLDSMVVGEREISGQLRRALVRSRKDKTLSQDLSRAVESALRTSRKVAKVTGLSGTGRSVVGVALDMYGQVPAQSLIVGTGAYAGATVAQLRARGAADIDVYSASGRAERFARGHFLTAVTDLVEAISRADLVVSCRGLGAPILTREVVARARTASSGPLTILDMALTGDVAGDVRDLPGVRVIGLKDVQKQVPATTNVHIERAHKIVAEGLAETVAETKGRQVDPIVRAVREHVRGLYHEEVERLPDREVFTKEEVERAIRHLATRIAHIPTVRARVASAKGETYEYVRALHTVLGVDLKEAAKEADVQPSKRGDVCPLVLLREESA
ncbi:MAG: glutamyl-tRNA reductase [Actinomycetaceae bacterium]|nr:glutamyl-tRNA reductase [Actinomycetaceae bacterium]